MKTRSKTICLLLAFPAGSFSACSDMSTEPEVAAARVVHSRPAPQPGTIAGTSKTMSVAGEYTPLALDRVARVGVEEGRLVVHGTSSSVTVDLPAGADAGRATRHWALVTEANLQDGRRQLTFTHSESLEDFSIELPESEGSVRYGGFEREEGGEVLVFAWGESSLTYWGWVTIARPALAE
jgi:hypothetical protein